MKRAGLVIVTLSFACSSSPVAVVEVVAVEGGVDARPASPPPPKSVSYRDTDPRSGFTQGTLIIEPAAASGAVRGYRVDFVDAGKSAGVLATLPPNGGLLHYDVTSGTVALAGDVAVRALGDGGTESAPVVVRVDNFFRVAPLSAPLPGPYRFVREEGAQKVDLLGSTDLFRCGLEGESCNPLGVYSGDPFDAVFDETRSRFVIAWPTALHFVTLAGTQVAGTHLPDFTGLVAMALDPAKDAVFVARPPVMLRCPLDASDCASTPLPGYYISGITVDPARQRVLALVVAKDGLSSIVACDEDLAKCDVGATTASYQAALALEAFLAVEPTTGDVFVAFERSPYDANSRTATVLRCSNTACARSDALGTAWAFLDGFVFDAVRGVSWFAGAPGPGAEASILRCTGAGICTSLPTGVVHGGAAYPRRRGRLFLDASADRLHYVIPSAWSATGVHLVLDAW